MNLQKKIFKNSSSQNFRFLFGILKKNLHFFFYINQCESIKFKEYGIDPYVNYMVNFLIKGCSIVLSS